MTLAMLASDIQLSHADPPPSNQTEVTDTVTITYSLATAQASGTDPDPQKALEKAIQDLKTKLQQAGTLIPPPPAENPKTTKKMVPSTHKFKGFSFKFFDASGNEDPNQQGFVAPPTVGFNLNLASGKLVITYIWEP